MSLHDHAEHEDHPQRNFLSSRAGLVLIGFLIIAGALLFTEHRAHVGALAVLDQHEADHGHGREELQHDEEVRPELHC